MLPALAIILLGGFDADALLWRDAVRAAGANVSSGQLQRVSNLIRGLKADGIWPLLDRLWIWAGENSTQARRDLVTRSVATPQNSPPFTANRGYSGDGLSAFLDLNIGASALAAATDASMFIGHWINTLAASDVVASGSADASRTSVILAPYSDGKIYPRLGDSTAGGLSSGGVGFNHGEKTAATTAFANFNGADLGSEVIVNGARSTTTMYALGANSNGVLANPAAAGTRLAATWAGGGGLGVAGRAALYRRLLTYLTAIGAN